MHLVCFKIVTWKLLYEIFNWFLDFVILLASEFIIRTIDQYASEILSSTTFAISEPWSNFNFAIAY